MRRLYPSIDLSYMKQQQENETITSYVNRFKHELTTVEDCCDSIKIFIFIQGLKVGSELWEEFMFDQPPTYEELLRVAGKYARGEEADLAKIEGRNKRNWNAEAFFMTMSTRNPELLSVGNYNEAFMIAAFMNGLLPGELNRRLARDPPRSLMEMHYIVEDHIRIERYLRARFGDQLNGEVERDGNESKKRKRKRNRNRKRSNRNRNKQMRTQGLSLY